MIDIDHIERVCSDGIEFGAGYVNAFTCEEVFELITRLREAEKDAARYRFMRDSGKFLESGDEFDAIVDQAMKEKGDE